MSVDLQHELTRAAPAPTRDLDVTAVRERTRQLRRRRTTAGVTVAVLVVAVGVLGVQQLTGRQPPPVVGPAPNGIAEQDAAWQHVAVGRSLQLPANAWGSDEIGSLEPTRTGQWDPEAAAVVAAAGDELFNDINRTVGHDGSVLLIPRNQRDDPRLIAIGPDGTQHVVDLPQQPDHTQAVWSPGGHVLLLATTRDGAATVHQLSPAGEIVASAPIDSYRPPSGEGWLTVHGGEVWAGWSGDEASEEPVPQIAQLTTDDGDTIVDVLDWQPLEQSGVAAPMEATGMGLVPSRPNTIPRLTTTETDADHVLLEDGQVTVDAGAPPNAQHLVTLAARDGNRWTLADGHLGGATQVQRYATVLLADGDGVWVTGFPDVARAAAVHIGSDGRPWFLQITADGYKLTDLTPPDTGNSGSPPADTASPALSETAGVPAHETDESTGGPDIEIVAKHEGAPRQPGYVWVGWAHTEQELQDLWATFRLDGEPPRLSGEAVLLAATGESGSCPTRLTDTAVGGDTLHLSLVDEPAVTPPPDNYGCTSDFNPVTFVLRLDRDLVERVGVVDFGDTAVELGPAGQITHEDYGG